MILESDCLVHKATELDAIMGCENCGRRIESAYSSLTGRDLCLKCSAIWIDGFNEGVFKGMSGRIRVKGEKE